MGTMYFGFGDLLPPGHGVSGISLNISTGSEVVVPKPEAPNSRHVSWATLFSGPHPAVRLVMTL